MTAITEQLVSIIHTGCDGEAFKYVGPVQPGDIPVAERVRDYVPGEPCGPGADIICRSCRAVVDLWELRIGPEVASDES